MQEIYHNQNSKKRDNPLPKLGSILINFLVVPHLKPSSVLWRASLNEVVLFSRGKKRANKHDSTYTFTDHEITYLYPDRASWAV